MAVDSDLLNKYLSIRQQSVQLTEGLGAEDLVPQSMPDASPGKWHLAHTTWFFETFILSKYQQDFRWFDHDFCYLFNSYYDTVGERHARPQRGLLTRPTVEQVLSYRESVDEKMVTLLQHRFDEIAPLVVVGLHHEMQHQELFLTDLLHLLSHNPLHPSLLTRSRPPQNTINTERTMLSASGGMQLVGAQAENPRSPWETFSYDCEQPQHPIYQSAFKLSSGLVKNCDWLEFISDGAYQEPLLWMSDGWHHKNSQDWQSPLYWKKIDDQWFQFGLDGLQALELDAPVCHISFYEADAFARWKGKRLPREHEWEVVAEPNKIDGNFLESHNWRPRSGQINENGFESLFGDVWEWTQSPYSPYPGFNPQQGALGEYNGKFMVNQFVLKGGSCVTPKLQMRASYRNFFHPHQRWQFMGMRLAEDD